MLRSFKYLPLTGLCALLFGCAPDYSPNTYSNNAVQLANKVDSGEVIGYREVKIKANGTVGAVTGGAAGGVLGGEYGNSALAAVGGTTIGAMLGSTLEHAASDTTGWEYIVRKTNGDMISVTQREKKPLELGRKVLVINGPQARVVPDYSMAAAPPPQEKTEGKPNSDVKIEGHPSPSPDVSAQSPNGQAIAAQPPPVSVVVPVPAPAAPPIEAPGTESPSSTSESEIPPPASQHSN